MRLAVVVLVACGSNTPNAMIGRPHALETIGAKREAILVETGNGAYRVWLDTGDREQITKSPGATLTRNGTAIYREDDRYVVERAGAKRIVPDVIATRGYLELSPDEKRFAISEPSEQLRSEQAYITVIGIADLAYRRYSVTPTAAMVRFSNRGDAIWLADLGKSLRLDLATGAIAEAIEEEKPSELDLAVCEARGWRLARVTSKQRQEIWLEPFARREDPEQLASIERRLLVSSTNNPMYTTTHWDRSGGKPGELAGLMFTRSCDHFVFTLGDSVYVGSVATGHYAHLLVGRNPMFER